jgi:hypothetical protein
VRGLDEVFDWMALGIGTEALLHHDGRTEVRIDVQLFRTLDPRSRVDFGAGFDPVILEPGNAWGGRVGLPMYMPLRGDLSLGIRPWAEVWSLGRSGEARLTSGGRPVGTVFQPRSESWSLGVEVVLGVASNR